MTSTLKLNDGSKLGVSSAPVNPSPGTNWDSLRELTSNAYQPHRSTRLRSALLALLLMVGLGSLSFVLRNHIPALVSFGEELSETVQRLTSSSPAPSTAASEKAVPDLRGARKPGRSSPVPVAQSQPDEAYNPAFHPFYATAVVGGRRVSLVSSNNIVVVDVAGGTWKYSSELE